MLFGGENADSYYDEGLTASMKGDFEGAAKHFLKALQLDARLTAALHQLGKCYLRLGMTAQAVQTLQQAVNQNPGLLAVQTDLGYALLDAGVPDRASRVFEAIIRTQPDQARASLGLAYCAFQQADWTSAALQARNAAQTGQANFAALFLWGRAARSAGLPDYVEALGRAEKLIQKTIEANPEQPEGYYYCGEVYFVREDFARALEFYRQAEDRTQPGKRYTAFNENFSRVDAIAKRGLCHLRLGNQEGARKAGKEILELNPSHKIGQMLSGNRPSPG